MQFRREDRSALSEWWFSIDRVMLGAILLLMVSGLVISLSASSPPIAAQKELGAFYFAKRQALFFIPSLFLLVACSLLPPKEIRRLALSIFLISMFCMILVFFFGIEKNGARRWLEIMSFSIQPSEFVKPAFVVLIAWLFSQRLNRPDMPATPIAFGLYIFVIVLLVVQPDIGQAGLLTMVWAAMFFLVGLSMKWVMLIVVTSISGIAMAYLSLPHVAERIDKFLDPTSGDNYQLERAIESFQKGGWFGQGPGEGKLKLVLPDSHTDFIFAVVAEEFGLLFCLLLVALFAFVVIRAFLAATKESDTFIRLALTGLIMLFGLQAIINMSVNLGLLPAKGMTLPFISYGGSSMIAMSITMGMVLGFMRKRFGLACE